jgi:SAM-dependent methyltransferase
MSTTHDAPSTPSGPPSPHGPGAPGAPGTMPKAMMPPGMPDVDPAQVQAFAGKFTLDMSAAMASLLIAIGDRLDLFRHLATGPTTPAGLAERAGCSTRYVREWLHGMVSSGYVEADAESGEFSLPAAHAAVLAIPSSPINLAAGAAMVPDMALMTETVVAAFRSGEGIPQDQYPDALYQDMARMSAGWMNFSLVQQWLPAVEGVSDRLAGGGQAVDVGCGQGRVSIVLAQAFPRGRFLGLDHYGPNIEAARQAADQAGVSASVQFQQGDAATALPTGVDLVTVFDVLHDQGDPLPLLTAIRSALAPDGAMLVLENKVEPDPLDNRGAMSSLLWATSTIYCLPTTMVHGGDAALGTLGLPKQLLVELCQKAGFGSVEQVPLMTPFNALYVARP